MPTATANALQLSGIRSFEPDTPDEQTMVRFVPPLTIIHGANGCGKTVSSTSLIQ